MRFSLFLFLFSALTAIAAPSKTMLVFGDSLSAGYGIARETSWPALLDQKLATAHSPYRVVNASISGETTAGGSTRLPHALQEHKPAVVVIVLGANDGLRGLPIPAMQSNLSAMIAATRKAGARVLLVGMKLPPNYGLDYTAQFAQSYVDIAKRERIPLVPFLLAPIAARADAFQADGLHPVAAAQPLILEHLWPALKTLLK